MKKHAKGLDSDLLTQITKACVSAKEGDTFSGRLIVGTAIDMLSKGASLPPQIADYLAEALKGCIADPKNAGKALGLAASKGRPSHSKIAERDFEIAFGVYLERLAGRPLRDNRTNQTSAFTLVATEQGVSEETVERIWKTFCRPSKSAIGVTADLLYELPEVPSRRKSRVKK